jgi:hypothetical protein
MESPANIYRKEVALPSHLLEALRHFVSHHLMEFEAMTREPAVS